jgi:hypothetical protein
VFRFILTWVTPAYLLVILAWWAVTDALPILRLERAAGGGPVDPASVPYVWAARGILVALVVVFLILIRRAWRRNGRDDRAGLPELAELSPAGTP